MQSDKGVFLYYLEIKESFYTYEMLSKSFVKVSYIIVSDSSNVVILFS